MRTLAVIQARMGSTRLPGKVLRQVHGRPLLAYMLERVRAAKSLSDVRVATTTHPQDDPIADFCRQAGVGVFRGDENDVLDRYYRCALEAGPRADAVVRMTSDCPLLDPRVVDRVVAFFTQGGYDYAANTAPPIGTYPDGMDVEVFSFAALERAWKEARKYSEREHVTFYFWKNPGLFKTGRHDLPESLSRYRLTVDYPEDLQIVSAVLEHFHPDKPFFTMEDVLAFLDARPDLRSGNASIGWNQGWKSALEKDKKS